MSRFRVAPSKKSSARRFRGDDSRHRQKQREGTGKITLVSDTFSPRMEARRVLCGAQDVARDREATTERDEKGSD